MSGGGSCAGLLPFFMLFQIFDDGRLDDGREGAIAFEGELLQFGPHQRRYSDADLGV